MNLLLSIIGQRRRTHGVLWTPDLLGASLALWLDADDADTITRAALSVSQWSDKSGNNRHATQASSALQPSYTESGLNSKALLTFNDDGFVLASGVAEPRDMFSVSRGYGFLYSANTSTERLVPATTAGATSTVFWNSSGPTSVLIPTRNTTDTYIEQYSLAGRNWNIAINASNVLSGTSSVDWTNGNLFNQIGLRWSAATGVPAWTGAIAEIIWTNSAISLADRQKTEGYLAHKWGLTASLPIDHPYKTTAPTA